MRIQSEEGTVLFMRPPSLVIIGIGINFKGRYRHQRIKEIVLKDFSRKKSLHSHYCPHSKFTVHLNAFATVQCCGVSSM